MFRSPQPGDWAAEDEDTSPLPSPAPASPTPEPAAPPAAAPAARAPRQDAPRQDARGSERGRFDRDRNNSGGGRFDREGGRFDRDRADHGAAGSGRFDRDRNNSGGGRFDREGGRFDRDRADHGGGGSGRYDRDRADGGGGRFDRARNDRDNDRGGRFEREGGRYEGGGRADASRWGHSVDRRGGGGGGGGGRDMPVDQGFVVSIKENFGFVSCMERDGDLFFHISEAPVDVQLQDEVEFRVKFNQRSDKEMACQLVALPKGTIKVEQVSEELYDGVVTKSLPRGGHGGGGRGFFNNRDDGRRQREEHGLIEVKKSEESETEADAEPEAATEEQGQTQEGEGEEEAAPKKTPARRDFVRFTSESVAAADAKEDGDQEQSARPKKNLIPHFGDEVRFRIATHRKTGAKRAVEITITVSAREKLDKEIEAKLASMTRENGVVDRVKNGGGFIKCCDRPVDIYFPFHELREPAQAEEDEKSGKKDGEQADTEDKPRRGRQAKGPTIRDGDEVSFFVYEDQEGDSGRSRPRLTAIRVQKLPPGTVSFEDLLRSDVEGLVSKLPKEPRNGPEVIGSIAVASVESTSAEKANEAKATAVEATPESEGKPSKKKKGKDGKATKQKVTFRLCDTEDTSYVPHIDDKVVFDEVLDKRTGKVKAVKVRVVQLNPKNRETGVINAMKEDFGFIKCAERSGDAYFRFSDVMGASRSFNSGTEVAFDVIVDSKSDHIRATRLQILPRGTIKWEDVAAEGLEGKIIAVPSSRRGHNSNRGGRGDKSKPLQKFVHGKIRFATPQNQHLIDFLPELKEKLDAAFITSEDVPEEPQKEAAEGDAADKEDKSKDTEEKAEIRVSFPNTLSKFECAALHEYTDWLGLTHESSGEASHRHLDIVGSEKISTKTVEEKLVAAAPELTVEFLEDDVDDVRYNPRVGDRVKFTLVVVKRTKQFQCKLITCVEAASTQAKAANPRSDAAKGEGFIVSVKPEGFGFIQPAQTVPGSLEENLFFHIKEITTGQALAELKEGTEVQYTIFVDEKKKKNRAVAIGVVPAGTIKNVVPESVMGVVTKASFLHRMKGGPKGRFAKSNNKASTLGQIRLAVVGNDAEEDDAGSDAEDGDSDEEAEESEEATQDVTEAKGGDAETESKDVIASDDAKKTEKKDASQKKPGKQFYLYNIRDIADPTVVLREGDEVEFIPQVTPKNLRAAHIRLVASHAEQGVVTRITEDLGGVIRLDGDELAVEARFTARAVLRGDVLSEGDRVEFAYRQPSATPSIKNVTKKAETEEKKEVGEEEKPKDEEATKEAEPILGQALSVLRISSSPNPAASSQRGSRSVNSTLREAMRQVGANAMVASRMAKGPDGTRGFTEGWGTDSKDDETEATSDDGTVETETSTTTVSTTTTTTTTTEQSEA
ncbi:Cold shock domain-containing protein E1 [Phytophthora pseudosyringae]|uniref:Cold shock domain-containing protein E1 n=1 Tax=Phytophthora pseudosyringae TaxID=221518 RepID=A0A8T1W1N3_9STRA|nr:Cold shock domain-containing protein E1 [Phytophthora pseudosyringae]